MHKCGHMISSLHTLLFVKLANVQLQLVIYGDFRLFLIFAMIRCETMTDRKKEPLDSKPTTPVLVRI